MTIEKTTTKSSKTTDESAAADALTRVVDTVTRDIEGLKDRLAKASVGLDTLRNVGIDAADALNTSGKALADGVFAFDNEMLKFAKVSAKEGLDAAKGVINAKSLEELVLAKRKFAQKHLSVLIDYGRKLVQICAETSRDVLDPITQGFSAAAKKATDLKAAD
jgi:phasin family protein